MDSAPFAKHPRVETEAPCGRIVRVEGASQWGGLCFAVELPNLPEGDGAEAQLSSLRLFEDGRELGPAHEPHQRIGELGGGRFSHWGHSLFFSSSDGSDPRTNHRQYQIVSPDAGTVPHSWLDPEPHRGGLLRLARISQSGGACFSVELPNLPEGDDAEAARSNLRLFEDGRELGPGHELHERIAELGGGRFSHWGHGLFFSSSDGSDPRTNGRQYQIVFPRHPWLEPEPEHGGLVRLPGAARQHGLCFSVKLPLLPEGDDGKVQRSGLRLFEDGRELGPGHVPHDLIGELGGGRFSHWGRVLYFSSSDGSDPGANGRQYQAVFHGHHDARRSVLLAASVLDLRSLDEEWRYIWGERVFEAFVPGAHVGEQSRSHFADAEFRADYERYNPVNHRTYDSKFTMKELFKLALPLDGHVAECGVYLGASAHVLAKSMANSPHGASKKLHLFDSFKGLSQPDPKLDGSHWSQGDLACTAARVAANLAAFSDRLVLHEGWIPDRFVDIESETFCFVHIDLDLFDPTRDALAFFKSRMSPGGLILCDDYGYTTCPGARRAMDHCARDLGLPVVHLATGQGLMIFSGRT